MDSFGLAFIFIIGSLPCVLLFGILTGVYGEKNNYKKMNMFFSMAVASALLMICGFIILFIACFKSNSEMTEKIYAEENYKETILSEDFVEINYLHQNIKYIKEDTITELHYDYVTYNFDPHNGVHIYVYDEMVGIK